MAIDWSLATQQPNILGNALQGYQAGQEARRVTQRRNALAQYAANPGGDLSGIIALDPELAIQLQGQQRQDRVAEQTLRRQTETDNRERLGRQREASGQIFVALRRVAPAERQAALVSMIQQRPDVWSPEEAQAAAQAFSENKVELTDAQLDALAQGRGVDPNAGDFTIGSGRYRAGATEPYARSQDPVVTPYGLIPGAPAAAPALSQNQLDKGMTAPLAAPAPEPTAGMGAGAGMGSGGPPPPPPEPAAPDQIWSNMITRESGGRQSARSPVGAFGVAQLMPATARLVAQRLGDPSLAERAQTDPVVNEQLGRAYFDQLREQFGSDAAAAAAYNAGPQAVQDWINGTSSRYYSAALGRYAQTNPGRIRLGQPEPGQEAAWAARIPYRETREYVAAVVPSGGNAPPPANQTAPQPEGVDIGGGRRLIPMETPALRLQREEAARRTQVDEERLRLAWLAEERQNRPPPVAQGREPTPAQRAQGIDFIEPNGRPHYADRPRDASQSRMPAPAVAREERDTAAVAAATDYRQRLGTHLERIRGVQLVFSPTANARAGVTGILGSTENTRGIQEFRADILGLQNAILQLAVGPQTDSDARRAADEVLANMSDSRAVERGIQRLLGIQQRAERVALANINRRRGRYGDPPLRLEDVTGGLPEVYGGGGQGSAPEFVGATAGGGRSTPPAAAARPPARPQASTRPPPRPQVGTTRNGYRYTGGDPASPSSWQRVR